MKKYTFKTTIELEFEVSESSYAPGLTEDEILEMEKNNLLDDPAMMIELMDFEKATEKMTVEVEENE